MLRSRPPRPAFRYVDEWPWPERGIIATPRHTIKRLINAVVDSGWFGLSPLQTHIVICGFGRAGSTLLQLMVETCVSNVRSFGAERLAASAAQYAFRNHTYMVSKAPFDVFWVDEIRAFYASRRADARFVLTVRDPRAALTSVHPVFPTDQPDGYFANPTEWVAYYEHVRYAQQFDDAMTVKYEDLICRPAEVQRRMTEFIGWHVHLSFDQFHTAAPPNFDRNSLNGLRPLDPSRVDAWRQEKHRARIRRVLCEIPKLPEYLIELGYEHDTKWVRDYL
jgi:hypothetical protein